MNAIALLDNAYSGQNSCKYKVGEELYDTKPCPSEMASLLSYLEVSYECIKGRSSNMEFVFFCNIAGQNITLILKWLTTLSYCVLETN